MRDRITIRMTFDMITRIDAWIAKHSSHVSRQEAVRQLLELSLGGADGMSEPPADGKRRLPEVKVPQDRGADETF